MSFIDPLEPEPDEAFSPALPADAWAEKPLGAFPEDGPAIPPPPPKPPHPNFGWAVLWALGFMLVVNGTAIGAAAFVVVAEAIWSREPKNYLKGLLEGGRPSAAFLDLLGVALLVAEAVSVAVAVIVLRIIVGRDWTRRVALQPPSAAHVLLVLIGLPGALLIPDLIYALAIQVLPSFNNSQQTAEMAAQWPFWFAVLVIGVGPGVGEELWCRGFLGRGLIGHYGWISGVLLTSLLFGIMHLDPPQVVGTMILGLWLHYVYLMSRSLWLSMFLHLLNNSLAVAQVKFGAALKRLDDTPAALQVALYVTAGLLFAGVIWALYRSRARLVPAAPGDGPAWHPAFPGVEAPPPGSGMRLLRPWPSALSWGIVLTAAAAFAAAAFVSGRAAGLLP
jgi:membrane protease YdiL (CAAX protease family)